VTGEQDPHTEPVPAAGEVRLPAGPLGTTPDCPYRVERDVMVIDRALARPWCKCLAQAAARNDGWSQSTQVQGRGQAYRGVGRTSESLSLAGIQGLEDYVAVLEQVLGGAARFYACWNRHVVVGRSGGWEVLRYRPGDVFGEHVDQIAGHEQWGQRQLSCLAYLTAPPEGGRTVFCNPEWRLEVAPEPGRIVLFPPGVTHPHRADPPVGGDKYVVVGWIYS